MTETRYYFENWPTYKRGDLLLRRGEPTLYQVVTPVYGFSRVIVRALDTNHRRVLFLEHTRKASPLEILAAQA